MSRRLRLPPPHRRGFLTGVAGLLGATALTGCDQIAKAPWGRRSLEAGEDANLFVQRLLLTPASLVREFPESAISAYFKPNGTVDPEDRDYKALAAKSFEGFRLEVSGLVEHPQSLSLSELRGLPSRTQITRHDCVEGWSSIGKWTGVPLSELLNRAGLKPQARYIVFHCFDTMDYAGGGLEGGDQAGNESGQDTPAAEDKPKGAGGLAWGGSGDTGSSDAKAADTKATGHPGMSEKPVGQEDRTTETASGEGDAPQAGRPIRYYESIDLTDAFHPQTILAYAMNGQTLPVAHGAPLRLRLERQLGYKQAKYIRRIEVVESLAKLGDGKGGYWEDRGYEWYAGI